MPWQVEQNTGAGGWCIRCVWWKGYIYAFTENEGIWRRDGIGPWTQVFINGNNGGTAWLWEEDNGGQGAIYCSGGGGVGPGGNRIYRSVDGTNWTLDVDLNVAFGLQGSYNPWSVIGGYGDYLYLANYDVGVPTTFFYRRDLAGNWAVFGAAHAGAEGLGNRGIIGFGGEVYWTNSASARYWDGAAWSIEATLDAQCGSTCFLSVIDDILYVLTSTSASLIGGYYWRTTTATEWAFMNLPVPDNTWGGHTLCQGQDGEAYCVAQDGTTLRIYQKVGPLLSLLHYQATVAVGLGTRGGICTDATGEMYFGTNVAGNVQFFEFAGTYTVHVAGLPPQALDCDGDGDALCICLYHNTGNFPLLISAPLQLIEAITVGSRIFDPGTGTAINVRCIDVGDNYAVAGHFGNNRQVEVTTDAGIGWTDADVPMAWGAGVAQPLIVSPTTLDKMIINLSTDTIIYETLDCGVTAWNANSAAVGYTPGAMVKTINGHEILLGDDAANSIEYTPNTGATLTDITDSFTGYVTALEITT